MAETNLVEGSRRGRLARIRAHPAVVPWITTYYLASVILSRIALLAIVSGGELGLAWLELHAPVWLGIEHSEQFHYVQWIVTFMSVVFDIAVLGTAVVTGAFDIFDTYRDRRRDRAVEKGLTNVP